ncbi:MAG: hypothetical protein BroJett040_25310 [Oligoflexia bacterium]|nr:MAG: hypothetical protein BroJett040_25310 [Oligoflexia bacterium]
MKKTLLGMIAITLSLCLQATTAYAGPQVKEWTFLVFLNGHNNLDRFGDMNIRQMEEVGSTDQVNLVAQWASLRHGNTRRVFVEKGSHQVVEEMAPVDMGDYHQLVEFVRWAKEKYPAKKYFINVWNHGNGWHLQKLQSGEIKPTDISYDDRTGNKITTEQLGLAMNEAARITGSKIELYGSDACLMSMAEVAAEMSDSVSYFAGSQEVEPGEGWPYANFIRRWVANPKINGGELGKILSEEYYKAYTGGVYGRREITFSIFDLAKMDIFNQAISQLSAELRSQPREGMSAARASALNTESYTSSDYKDIHDFVDLLEKQQANGVRSGTIAQVRSAISQLVIVNHVTNSFKRSHGISVWLPTEEWEYSVFSERYSGLQFHRESGWGDFLNTMVRFK